MDIMKFSAYRSDRRQEVDWFRTGQPLEAGFYRRHARGDDPPVSRHSS